MSFNNPLEAGRFETDVLDKTFRTFIAKPFGRSLASLTATVDVLISQGGTSRTSYLVLFFLQSVGLSFVIVTSQT